MAMTAPRPSNREDMWAEIHLGMFRSCATAPMDMQAARKMRNERLTLRRSCSVARFMPGMKQAMPTRAKTNAPGRWCHCSVTKAMKPMDSTRKILISSAETGPISFRRSSRTVLRDSSFWSRSLPRMMKTIMMEQAV